MAVITFVGDVVCPFGVDPRKLAPIRCDFAVANLEGALASAPPIVSARRLRLYSRADIVGALSGLGVRVLSLANNHIMDLPGAPKPTIDWLESRGFVTCGAGHRLEDAARPAVVAYAGRQLAFLAFGWNTIGCIEATADRPGTSPLHPGFVLRKVAAVRGGYPGAFVVILMHWNYELELYPQPMHRQLAFAAVEAGADMVVGHHPHVVGGIEFHRGRPILYSLGNWFVPRHWGTGTFLRYPPVANTELAFSWDLEAGQGTCHWFRVDDSGTELEAIGSEDARTSRRLADLSPFAGASHHEYKAWMKRNRARRRGLPIYRDMNDHLSNLVRDRWMQVRDSLVQLRELTRPLFAARHRINEH